MGIGIETDPIKFERLVWLKYHPPSISVGLVVTASSRKWGADRSSQVWTSHLPPFRRAASNVFLSSNLHLINWRNSTLSTEVIRKQAFPESDLNQINGFFFGSLCSHSLRPQILIYLSILRPWSSEESQNFFSFIFIVTRFPQIAFLELCTAQVK